jgi:hypothetical protein
MLLCLTLLDTAPTDNGFVPKDVAKSYALGCVVAGDAGPPPFAETQVFVKMTKDNPNWDYRPKMSRRDIAGGGVPKAIDDCIEWYQAARKKIVEASNEAKAASK